MSDNAMTTATSGGALMSKDDLRASIGSVVTGMKTGSSIPYLRLLTEGLWVYGQEDTEVAEKSQWAINPYSVKHGYIAWAPGEVLGEVMQPFNTLLPPSSTLETFSKDECEHGWQKQYGFELTCISGPDKGATVLWKGTSVGLQKAQNAYLLKLAAQLDGGSDSIVAVVSLGMDHYKHKKHGRVYTPELEYHTWTTMDDSAAPAEEEEEEKPKRTRKPRTRPAEEATPRSRRRAAPAEEELENEADEDEDEDDPEVEDFEPEEEEEETPPPRRRRRG